MKKLIIGTIIVLAAISTNYTVEAKTKNCGEPVELIDVLDGDTVRVKIDDNIFMVRLTGIDCYESIPSRRSKLQAEYYNIPESEVVARGKQATTLLRGKLGNKPNNLTMQFKGIDCYHRGLGVLYKKGENINEYMLNSGYCPAYVRLQNK